MNFTHRLPLLLLLALPACTPKDDGDEDTGDDAGTSTTGDEVTTGNSDPTTPATASVSSGGTAPTGTTAGTASTAGTGEDPTTATATTGADPTVGTSTTTAGTDPTGMTGMTGGDPTSDTDDPLDPPQPCAGQGTPLVGITTQIGYLKSQVPPREDPTGGSTSPTGGGELDPGTLFVKLSDRAFTCADPNALLPCGPHWEVTITIPPEFQSPGVHNLLGQNVWGSAMETGPIEGNECSFGGGSFGATFEILAIDDDVVEGRLCNVESFFFDVDPQLEGTFTASRCPE